MKKKLDAFPNPFVCTYHIQTAKHGYVRRLQSLDEYQQEQNSISGGVSSAGGDGIGIGVDPIQVVPRLPRVLHQPLYRDDVPGTPVTQAPLDAGPPPPPTMVERPGPLSAQPSTRGRQLTTATATSIIAPPPPTFSSPQSTTSLHQAKSQDTQSNPPCLPPNRRRVSFSPNRHRLRVFELLRRKTTTTTTKTTEETFATAPRAGTRSRCTPPLPLPSAPAPLPPVVSFSYYQRPSAITVSDAEDGAHEGGDYEIVVEEEETVRSRPTTRSKTGAGPSLVRSRESGYETGGGDNGGGGYAPSAKTTE